MSQALRMAAVAAWLAATVPLLAHHSLAEYDPKVAVTLSGPVTTVEWINPHTFVYVAVTTPDDKTDTWRVEGGSPRQMAEHKITREMFAIGAVVTIDGFQAKDHSLKAWGRDITFPDGSKRYMGSGVRPGGPPPPPPRPPSPLFYILTVAGAVLAGGFVIMWRRRPKKRDDEAR